MSEKTINRSAEKMGVAPVGPLLASLAIPMMISMLVQALYNVVDSIFVSRVSEAALSAVSLAFPVQSLLIAISVGTGVGVNSYLSRNLGQGNREEASRAAVNGLFLAVCSFVVFALAGLFGAKAFMYSQTTDPAIREAGDSYLGIVMVFSLGMCIQCMGEKLLTATGRSSYAMATQLIGAVTNIILDPIFIFGYCGLPAMGAAGAAIATVLGQTIGAVVSLILNVKINNDISLSFKGFRPNLHTIGRIYQVGLPSIGMQSIGSVMTFFLNHILIGFSSTAVAVFGVYFKMQSFVFMPIFGLNNGMVPIVSYNYGARKPERIMKAMKLSMISAFCIMVFGFLVAEIFPGTLLGIFNASDDMLALGIPALRIIAIHFLIAWFNIIASSIFQALGKGMLALWVSVIRQLVVLIPVAYLLSLTGDVGKIWFAFPIAEVASLILCTVFLSRVYTEIIKPMY